MWNILISLFGILAMTAKSARVGYVEPQGFRITDVQNQVAECPPATVVLAEDFRSMQITYNHKATGRPLVRKGPGIPAHEARLACLITFKWWYTSKNLTYGSILFAESESSGKVNLGQGTKLKVSSVMSHWLSFFKTPSPLIEQTGPFNGILTRRDIISVDTYPDSGAVSAARLPAGSLIQIQDRPDGVWDAPMYCQSEQMAEMNGMEIGVLNEFELEGSDETTGEISGDTFTHTIYLRYVDFCTFYQYP